MSYLVQRPRRVAGQRKIQIQRQVLHLLGRLAQGRVGLDLGQAVGHEPDAVHQQPVGGALDLKVAEEGVSAEQRQHLVQDVVALRVGVRRLVGGEGLVRERERVDGAADLGAEREEREVADQPGGWLGGVEDGVVGLGGCGGVSVAIGV
jgi:hypothetical protein